MNNYNKLLQLRPHYLNAWNRLINHPTGLNIKCLGNSVMIKFPSHTELDLERVQTSCTGKQMKLTSEEKDLVQWPRSSKQSKKEDTTGHQRKRGKKPRSVDDLPSTSKQTTEIGQPPVTTELRSSPLPSIEGNSSVGRSKQLADCPPEKHLSAVLETDTGNQNVLITSQPGN